mmetsp:Transcript_6376/g.18347  ORF Transcript_6376/g.18347 Transcript_6376/m.18347 type:complete len:376 (+) Transcript_6376:243-1370(+)
MHAEYFCTLARPMSAHLHNRTVCAVASVPTNPLRDSTVAPFNAKPPAITAAGGLKCGHRICSHRSVTSGIAQLPTGQVSRLTARQPGSHRVQTSQLRAIPASQCTAPRVALSWRCTPHSPACDCATAIQGMCHLRREDAAFTEKTLSSARRCLSTRLSGGGCAGQVQAQQAQHGGGDLGVGAGHGDLELAVRPHVHLHPHQHQRLLRSHSRRRKAEGAGGHEIVGLGVKALQVRQTKSTHDGGNGAPAQRGVPHDPLRDLVGRTREAAPVGEEQLWRRRLHGRGNEFGDHRRKCQRLAGPPGTSWQEVSQLKTRRVAERGHRREGQCHNHLLERLQQWGHRTQLHRKGRKRGHGADEAAQGEGGAFVAQVQLDLP